jgi:hypothetical protein
MAVSGARWEEGTLLVCRLECEVEVTMGWMPRAT